MLSRRSFGGILTVLPTFFATKILSAQEEDDAPKLPVVKLSRKPSGSMELVNGKELLKSFHYHNPDTGEIRVRAIINQEDALTHSFSGFTPSISIFGDVELIFKKISDPRELYGVKVKKVLISGLILQTFIPYINLESQI